MARIDLNQLLTRVVLRALSRTYGVIGKSDRSSSKSPAKLSPPSRISWAYIMSLVDWPICMYRHYPSWCFPLSRRPPAETVSGTYRIMVRLVLF
jgi:hypothetical protein